jgi:uncharacterized UPF0160 family protein
LFININGPGPHFQTKLSSAGLIYAHYGKEVIAKIVGDEKANENSAHEKMYVTLYKTFIEAIDAIDNGIQQFDGIPRFQTKYSSQSHRPLMQIPTLEHADFPCGKL